MRNKIIIFLFTIIIVLMIIINQREYISKNFIKWEYRSFLKDFIFFNIKIQNLANQNKNYSNYIKTLNNHYLENIFPQTILSKTSKRNLGDKEAILREYPLPVLEKLGPRAYLAENKNYLYMVTGNGSIFKINLDKLSNNLNQIHIESMVSNLHDLLNYEHEPFKDRNLIKGITISSNRIYVSVINKVKEYCYANKIFVGELNLNEITFTDFFELPECQPQLTFQTGGNLENFGDAILLTVGDHDSYIRDFPEKLPQDKSSLIGKILSIDKKTQEVQILSMGHRNQQGIYYDEENKRILTTEHGPEGGDEINLIKINEENIIPNYGWGVSSYGEHYGGKNEYNKRNYDQAPLHKSHKDYGFIEPIIFFTPSIGITQIEKYIPNTNKNINEIFFFGAMGNDPENGGNSIYKIEIKDDQIISLENINEVGRVRDVMYSKRISKLFFYSESNPSLYMVEF